jgi:hypothetical protein
MSHHHHERRAAGRVYLAFAAVINVTGTRAGERLEDVAATVTDVGGGGAMIHTHELLARGWRVRLRLEDAFPETDHHEITAEVAWSRRNALDLHGRCTSGLTFVPHRQPPADRLVKLFRARPAAPPVHHPLVLAPLE